MRACIRTNSISKPILLRQGDEGEPGLRGIPGDQGWAGPPGNFKDEDGIGSPGVQGE